MFNRWQRELVSLTLLVGLSIGCSDRIAPASRTTKRADNSPAGDATELASGAARDSTASQTETAQFEPPFPDRQELFLPPGPQEPVKPQAVRKDSSIQVKGFANADGMHALLMIDGRLTAMRVGESRGGVEVLSVKPPRVMLRQDGQSWTESLSPNGKNEHAK